MAYLLDTVAVLRWWTDVDRLGRVARSIIADGEEVLYVSVVCVWEIANKNRIGKLDTVARFEDDLPQLLRRDRFLALDISAAHALRAGYLSGEHRDPFDRLIAGQALVEGMTVLTNDPQITAFGCETLW